jgi:hypothetical protein
LGGLEVVRGELGKTTRVQKPCLTGLKGFNRNL